MLFFNQCVSLGLVIPYRGVQVPPKYVCSLGKCLQGVVGTWAVVCREWDGAAAQVAVAEHTWGGIAWEMGTHRSREQSSESEGWTCWKLRGLRNEVGASTSLVEGDFLLQLLCFYTAEPSVAEEDLQLLAVCWEGKWLPRVYRRISKATGFADKLLGTANCVLLSVAGDAGANSKGTNKMLQLARVCAQALAVSSVPFSKRVFPPKLALWLSDVWMHWTCK